MASKGRTFRQSNLNNELNESLSYLDDEDSPDETGMDAEETTPVSRQKGNLSRLPTIESAPHMLQNAITEVARGKYQNLIQNLNYCCSVQKYVPF